MFIAIRVGMSMKWKKKLKKEIDKKEEVDKQKSLQQGNNQTALETTDVCVRYWFMSDVNHLT